VQVERTVRAYKEEYESISRVVNQLPSRAQINAYVRSACGLYPCANEPPRLTSTLHLDELADGLQGDRRGAEAAGRGHRGD
jgi:hypothetical protein